MAKKSASATGPGSKAQQGHQHSVQENPLAQQMQEANNWLNSQSDLLKEKLNDLYKKQVEKTDAAFVAFINFLKPKIENDRGFRALIEHGYTLTDIAEIDSGSSLRHLEEGSGEKLKCYSDSE